MGKKNKNQNTSNNNHPQVSPTINSTSANQQPNQSPSQFNDQKEHYESLVSYFKYLVTITGICLSIIVAAVIWATYQDRKEMKEELKSELKEIKEETKAKALLMNEELKERQTKLDLELANLNNEAAKTIQQTKTQSLAEINYLRNDAKTIAMSEANKKIENVFEKNNIEDFIVNVAMKRMEPEVNNIVEKNRIALVDSAISKITEKNPQRNQEGLATLQLNINHKLLPRQINRIIDILNKKQVPSNNRNILITYLSFEISDEITGLFKDIILHEREDSYAVGQAFMYFVKPGVEHDFGFYKKVIASYETKAGIFEIFLENAKVYNKELVIPLLNSRELVDYVHENANELGMLKNYKDNIFNSLRTSFSVDELSKTYYFSKKWDSK